MKQKQRIYVLTKDGKYFNSIINNQMIWVELFTDGRIFLNSETAEKYNIEHEINAEVYPADIMTYGINVQ